MRNTYVSLFVLTVVWGSFVKRLLNIVWGS